MFSVLPDWLIEICKAIRLLGGKGFLVGGCVRDRLLGYSIKDYDLEVYALPSQTLKELLEKFGKINVVGEQFAVYKLQPKAAAPVEVDVSLPRRESKRSRGHRGFLIEGDPWMTFEEAVSRRDFTINAILQDPLTESIIDPLCGVNDLVNRRLRVANPKTFKEDSLRVLRAAQLASRYNLSITSETIKLCRETALEDLPKDRVYKEFEKILLFSPNPSIGLRYLQKLCVIQRLFPSLIELQSSPTMNTPYSQDTNWNYTLKSLERGKVVVEALCIPKRISILLAIIGIRLSLPNLVKFLDELGIHTVQGYPVRRQVIGLRKVHLIPYKIFYQRLYRQIAIICFRRLGRIIDLELLNYLCKALYLESSEEFLFWLEEILKDLSSGNSQSLITGHDVLSKGIKPGPKVKSILRQLQEFQIEGEVLTISEAQLLLEKLVRKNFQENELKNGQT